MENFIKSIKHILLVIIGTAILSFGTAVFLFPFDIVSGGISGVAIVLYKVIGSDIITKEVIISFLTWIVFVFGFIVLGKNFALKTLVSAITYPVFISVFMKLLSEDTFGGYFNIAVGEYSEIGIIIAAVAGGALVGIGCAISFLGGGSTGGTDIIAFIICKFFPNFKSSKVIFVIDAVIVILGMFVIGNFLVSVLGILSAFVCAVLIDKVFLGGTRAFTAHIISSEYEKISRLIIERLERTTTILLAKGGFSGEEKRMVMVSFTMAEYPELLNIINEADRYAFVTVHRAYEINGEGWTR